MSFGFSVGDFFAVGKLINDISSSIRHASASYQALDIELHTLKRALDEIEHLQCPASQEVALNTVKVTALSCRQSLIDFSSKLKKCDIMNQQKGTSSRRMHSLEKLGRKFEWGLRMEEEAVRLRAAVVVHVGFLNLRLSWLGLTASFPVTQKLDEHHLTVRGELDQKVDAIIIDQFATGPSSQKVKAGEYLLYNSSDSKHAIRQEHSLLIPGMSITVTLIMGRYGSLTLARCPRAGCLSYHVVVIESGNKLCAPAVATTSPASLLHANSTQSADDMPANLVTDPILLQHVKRIERMKEEVERMEEGLEGLRKTVEQPKKMVEGTDKEEEGMEKEVERAEKEVEWAEKALRQWKMLVEGMEKGVEETTRDLD
ncbi:hypothetical protein G7Z17_g519 [Cylindrodendrum hubeiense]|uniref:Fungal N-terminal domain-containing protein n=1 Tax=Cylindrodendrum hubeiense TaxID=595255 RepID=A0A9P5HS14_9HYPO|nr:hypothetical protein G7Z17_g519 [Cylindrodendrum hubeiense]